MVVKQLGVQIALKGEDRVEIEVESDGLGRFAESLVPPDRFGRSEALEGYEALFPRAAQFRQRLREIGGAPAPSDTPRELLVNVGAELYDWLTAGRLGRRLARLLASDAREERLLLRLHFGEAVEGVDPSNAKLRALNFIAALPWELLFEAELDRFLVEGSKPMVEVVRAFDTPRECQPLQLREPVTCLVVAACPSTLSELVLESEIGAIEKAAGDRFRLRIVREASFAALGRAMEGSDVQILHFLGHGTVDAATGQGGLFFEQAKHKQLISAARLVDLFRRTVTPRSVVLNACESGRWPGLEDQSPLASVGPALARAGVGLVVAMQRPVNDRDAVAFAAAFYESLAQDLDLLRAVGVGRRRLLAEGRSWFLPVAMTCHGDLRPRAPFEASESLRIGVRSFDPASSTYRAPNLAPRAEDGGWLALEEHFSDGRRIRSPELWATVVVPRVSAFAAEALTTANRTKRDIAIALATHLSIAFLLGYRLNIAVTPRLQIEQRGEMWAEDLGPSGEGWTVTRHPLERGSDLVVAVRLSNSVFEEVESSVSSWGLEASAILEVGLPGGHTSVESGRHAHALAYELKELLKREAALRQAQVLHLFISGPAGFAFALGRHARDLPPFVLYEYLIDQHRGGTYEPSLRFPQDLQASPQPSTGTSRSLDREEIEE
jgi:hypothetical protein